MASYYFMTKTSGVSMAQIPNQATLLRGRVRSSLKVAQWWECSKCSIRHSLNISSFCSPSLPASYRADGDMEQIADRSNGQWGPGGGFPREGMALTPESKAEAPKWRNSFNPVLASTSMRLKCLNNVSTVNMHFNIGQRVKAKFIEKNVRL